MPGILLSCTVARLSIKPAMPKDWPSFNSISVSVRRVDIASVKPGARLDGEEIAKFTMHENIDNMEGLALRRDASGKTLLYMISDDNYNLTLQRTVLLMFEVAK